MRRRRRAQPRVASALITLFARSNSYQGAGIDVCDEVLQRRNSRDVVLVLVRRADGAAASAVWRDCLLARTQDWRHGRDAIFAAPRQGWQPRLVARHGHAEHAMGINPCAAEWWIKKAKANHNSSRGCTMELLRPRIPSLHSCTSRVQDALTRLSAHFDDTAAQRLITRLLRSILQPRAARSIHAMGEHSRAEWHDQFPLAQSHAPVSSKHLLACDVC